MLATHTEYHLDMISLALQCKKLSFDEIIKMFDDIVLPGSEQEDDDDKKEMCGMQIVKVEDDIKSLDVTASILETSIAETEGRDEEKAVEGISCAAVLSHINKQLSLAHLQRPTLAQLRAGSPMPSALAECLVADSFTEMIFHCREERNSKDAEGTTVLKEFYAEAAEITDDDKYQHEQTTCPEHRKVPRYMNADVRLHSEQHGQTTCPEHRKV